MATQSFVSLSPRMARHCDGHLSLPRISRSPPRPKTYQATFIRPGVFIVTWQEADGITVTHVEDFENDTVHAAITLPDQKFLTLTGSWTRLD
ncbi:MoaF-related domain-containing protein [Sinorhizobium meliloti]|uniref:MoaF-related domain-containing protein n=1 Tax=Rhizobium meliloti TaxID=382 RepID=UPI0001E4D397|nr:hypothetical protein [Sinorhizobium meliloti]MDE4586732.1 hypothetical protein [Sinorhizobium meliloti]SEJ69823.1 hypothetical protein SAMN04244575_05749 [Sinorhizobium meliloti]